MHMHLLKAFTRICLCVTETHNLVHIKLVHILTALYHRLVRLTRTSTKPHFSLLQAVKSRGCNKRQVTKQPETEFQDPRGLFELEHPTGL